MTDPQPDSPMTMAAFWPAFMRLPDVSGSLVVPTCHAEQDRLHAAIDSGLYRHLLAHYGKKCRKSFEGAAFALKGLVGSMPGYSGERLIGLAAWDWDQTGTVFSQIEALIGRHPWLTANLRVLKGEVLYREARRDPRTGATYYLDHLIARLARDTKGTHGRPFTQLVRDEYWTEPDHSMSESLIITPNAPNGQTLYLSYHAPRAMQRAGVPLFDLLQRVEAGDPLVFYSYIGGRGAHAPWVVVPTITEAWVAEQEQLLASSPSRFKRIILNIPAGDEGGLIVAEELRASLIQDAEPQTAQPGVQYFAAGDLGVTNDWTAIIVGHLDEDARLVVDVVRTWRGTPANPVSLVAVEDEILALHRRFRFRQLVLDQWQARQLCEQLQRQGVPARLVSIESTKLDKLVSLMKRAFSQRLVRVPARESDLLEQLESVQVIEAGTRGNRRRDLLRFQPGEHAGAGAHDDLVVTLALLLEICERSIGALAMHEIPRCEVEAFFRTPDADCYLWQGNSLPVQPQCRDCAAHLSTKAAREVFQARTGEPIGLREFVRKGHVRPNRFAADRRFRVQMNGVL